MSEEQGKVIATTILAIASCGILLAAAYSFFGKPTTAEGKERKRQAISGFRLAGWVLFTLAFLFLLLGCMAALLGKSSYSQPIHRIVAGIVCLVQSAIMLRWVNYWLKWFMGFLGYAAIKLAFGAVFGFSSSVPRVVAPRIVFLGGLLSVALAIAACWRFLNRLPDGAEKLALVLLAISFCLWITLDSVAPIITGSALLFAVQFGHGRRSRRKRHHASASV